MKLGLFVDLRNPPPWRRPWAELYGQTLDLIADADGRGIDAVWFSEHHLFEDGYLPQPLTFAAAAAARTRRMRIGTAVLLAALRHPRHVAEEAAVVDLVSDGRLELGIGAGYRVPEYEAFGADISRKYGATDAAVAEIKRLLADDTAAPPPAQRPVPIWLGYQGPQGARRAGRLGVGLLTLDRRNLEPYREALAEAGHDPASARLGGVVDIVVADDPEATMARILPHYAYQQDSYRRSRVEGTDQPVPSPLTAEKLRAKMDRPNVAGALHVLTPAEAVAELRARTDGLPVEHVYLWASVAAMPDDVVARHVELMATEVRPALAETADDQTVQEA